MSDLAHNLRIRFGLAPGEPTEEQLRSIIADLKALSAQTGQEPTVDQTAEIVKKHCPTFRTWKYAADVNLELRRQIAMLAAQGKK